MKNNTVTLYCDQHQRAYNSYTDQSEVNKKMENPPYYAQSCVYPDIIIVLEQGVSR